MGALMTASELARFLGVSRSTFYRYLRMGRFKDLVSPKPVGQRRFSRTAVERRYA